MEKKRYPPVNDKIEKRRMELGFTAIDVAHKARLSVDAYNDAESHADEMFLVVPLYHVKKICSILNIDLMTLFDIPCVFCNGSAIYADELWLRRDVLIRRKREKLSLTESQLGDRLGFYQTEVKLMETYTAHLESWVLENILWLSEILKVPPQILLDVQCVKCGR